MSNRGWTQSRRDETICSPARQCRENEKERIPSPVRDGINAARAIRPAIQIRVSSTTTQTLWQNLSFDGALSGLQCSASPSAPGTLPSKSHPRMIVHPCPRRPCCNISIGDSHLDQGEDQPALSHS